jgi:hypothetical protein
MGGKDLIAPGEPIHGVLLRLGQFAKVGMGRKVREELIWRYVEVPCEGMKSSWMSLQSGKKLSLGCVLVPQKSIWAGSQVIPLRGNC